MNTNEPFGWLKFDEVREHFESVGCGTIYKTGGECRVPLYTHPEKEQWIPVSERMPSDGQNVAFVVKSDLHDYLDGRILGGRYTSGIAGGFSVPGMHVLASHWMPLPDAPIGKVQEK